MGQAKQRREQAAALADFNRQVRENHGNTEWFVVRSQHLFDIPSNDRRFALLRPIIDWLHRCATPSQWPNGKPPLCIACDNAIAPGHFLPHAFILQVPWNWEQGHPVAVVSAACQHCAQKTDLELVQFTSDLAYKGAATVTTRYPT